MANSGHYIRSINAKLAREKYLPPQAPKAPRLTAEEGEYLSRRVAGLGLGESMQNVIHFAREKAEGALFLEEVVKTTGASTTVSTTASSSTSNTRLAGKSQARRLTDATVLLALHRDARTGSLAPIRQGKPRTKPMVPIVVACVRWSSTPTRFNEKKADVRRIVDKELLPRIWQDLQATGYSNCNLAEAVAAARFRPAVGSAVAGGARGEDAGVEEEHRVWEKVVKEDLAVATAVAVVGLNSLVSVSVERPPIEKRVAQR